MATNKAPVMDEEEGEGEASKESQVKVPESFQAECMKLVNSATTMAQLDYLSSEVNEMRTKISKSQSEVGMDKDSFSDKEMPAIEG